MKCENTDTDGPPRGSRLAWRLFSNYAFQLVNLGIRLFEQLLMIPLCISAWGTELYKDWLILYSIVTFIFWCSFGLDQYFGAKFLNLVALKDDKALRRQVHVALFSALIITLAIFAALYGTMLNLDIRRALTLSVMDRQTAMFCLAAMTLPVLLWMFMEVLRSLYRAYGDFSRGECLFAIFNGTQIVTVIVLLIAHRPPTTVALAYLVLGAVYALGTVIDVRRRYPAVSLGLAVPTRQELRELVPQSLLYFTNPLSIAITQNATMLLFGVLNVAALATVKYNVLRVFTGLTRQIGAQSFAVGSGIEMARQHAQNDLDACRQLYTNTGRIGACLVGLLAGLSIPVSTPFITLWTHGEVPRDMPLLLCLLAAIFLAAPGQASMSLLRYSHHPRPIAVASLAYSCGGLLLCFILVPQIGVIGAAIAFMITESLAVGIYQPIVVGSLFGFGAVRHILGSYAAGLCTFVPSFAIAAALFAAPGTGLVGVFLRVALWAVAATPIAALLAMTSAQRARLFTEMRRRLPGFRRNLAERMR